MLAGVAALSGCHNTATDVEQQASTTKVQECSWCPATDTSETTVGLPASPSPDLLDRLASEMAGTPFAGLTEDEVRSDISDICGAGEGGASRRGPATEAARLRADRLGVSGSAPGVASYAQLLETEADRRCP